MAEQERNKPQCVRCGRRVEDMTAEEIYRCQRIGASPEWGQVRNVVCGSCQGQEQGGKV